MTSQNVEVADTKGSFAAIRRGPSFTKYNPESRNLWMGICIPCSIRILLIFLADSMSTIITRRPQRGTAYSRNASYTNDHWNSIEEPGGRKLWMRLVIGFSLLAVVGTVLLALGAVLFQHAYDFHEEGHTALPMVLCIVSMGKICLWFSHLNQNGVHCLIYVVCSIKTFSSQPAQLNQLCVVCNRIIIQKFNCLRIYLYFQCVES